MDKFQEHQTILAVDDTAENLSIISGVLKSDYKVKVARDGKKALSIARSDSPPDLILLDIMMPEMNGYEICELLKDSPKTADIPVIFLTAKNQVEDEAKGFELGAVDYISKPFNPLIIKARVKTHLELVRQRRQTELLLENTLPKKVIRDLREKGEVKPDTFESVSVLFTDTVNFTETSSKLTAEFLISELSEIFSAFDEIIERNGCERVKTIGDAYMAVCGMPEENPRHAYQLTKAALEIIQFLEERNKRTSQQWHIRAGIHSGRAVGGIVGTKKYLYDIFGDTVNTASRAESASESMRVSITETTHDFISDDGVFTKRGLIKLKGKGEVPLYFVETLHDTEE